MLALAGSTGSQCHRNSSRGRAAEVLVNGNKAALVRERQPVEQIWKSEKIPAWLK